MRKTSSSALTNPKREGGRGVGVGGAAGVEGM